MTNAPKLTHLIDFPMDVPESKLVCADSSGQKIVFGEAGGKPVITYSYSEGGAVRECVLNDDETEAIMAWRNSGRRSGYWDWPGWEAVRSRNKPGSV